MGTQSAKVKAKAKEVKPWIRRFGRFGYMTIGIIYGMIGILAGLAAVGPGGKTTGTTGALTSIAEMPFGEMLLWVIGFGLIGYIIWGFIKAIMDVEGDGMGAKGLIKRIGFLISGIIYANLAFGAIKLASYTGDAGSSESEKMISAKIMEHPFGEWAVGVVGVIIIAFGLYELVSGIKGSFMKKFKVSEMNEKEEKLARISGKLGLISRGIVLSMIGFFFVRTAYTNNPEESKGLGGSLAELAIQPFGQFLLGIIAVGLILYGIYQIILGRYERMNFG